MQETQLQDLFKAMEEQLAAIEHERWALWQRYVHDSCQSEPDGALRIPGHLVERWERQIRTPYALLSEEEKNSDREQVRKYVPVVIANMAGNLAG